MATIYAKADKYLDYLKRLLRSEFNRFRLLGFDELNVVRVKREVGGTYATLNEAAQSRMLIVAKEAYEQAAKEVLGNGYESDIKKVPNSAWLAAMLKKYNRTTGYLYENEIDRKRLRYQEQILTAREYQDRIMYNDSLRKAASLLWLQLSHYMIVAVDEARIKAFSDNGIKYVFWNTQKDGKVCEECAERDGKKYRLDELPVKHYKCRCYFTAAKDE